MHSIYCYFDDSDTQDLQINVVAGYVAPASVWDKDFAPLWVNVLRDDWPTRISEFKASDCFSQHGEFEGWPDDKCNELVIRLISVIKQVQIFAGVGTAFFWPGKADPSGSKYEVSRWRRLMVRRGYGICVGQCLADVFDALLVGDAKDDIDTVQPILDEKEKFAEIVSRNFAVVKKMLPEDQLWKIESPIPGNSHKLYPLQAADLLAHEIMREVVNRCDGMERPPRKSLSSLMDTSGTFYLARIYEMPAIPIYDLYRLLNKPIRPQRHVLFKSSEPLRSPGTWGIKDVAKRE